MLGPKQTGQGALALALFGCGPPAVGASEGDGSATMADRSSIGDVDESDDAATAETGVACGLESTLCPDDSCQPPGEFPCCEHGGECPAPGTCIGDQIECPDGSCQLNLLFACCGHGGSCPLPGCEPEDAQTGPDACLSPEIYAWNGEACEAVIGCSCIGADCNTLPDDPWACLSAKADCLPAPVDDCGFELATLALSGTLFGAPWIVSEGVFAQVEGEGPALIELTLAPDRLTLLNYAFTGGDFGGLVGDSLVRISFIEGFGPLDATARLGGGFDPMGSFDTTVTVTQLELVAPMHADRIVAGSLDVVADTWTLAGEFELHGCRALYQVLP